MSNVNWLITPQKYHSASLFIDNTYFPSTTVLAAGSIGAGIECIISIEENDLVFYQTKIKLSKNLGDVERGDVIFNLAYNLVRQINVSLTRRGTFNWRNPDYPNGRYLLDLEIELKDDTVYHFELNALVVLERFINELRGKNVVVDDKICLVEYLEPINKDEKTRYDFIDKNYVELSNKYNLDNPRLKIQID